MLVCYVIIGDPMAQELNHQWTEDEIDSLSQSWVNAR